MACKETSQSSLVSLILETEGLNKKVSEMVSLDMKMVADWFNTWIWFHVLVDAAAHEAAKLAAKIFAFLDTLHGKDMGWMNICCLNPWRVLH